MTLERDAASFIGEMEQTRRRLRDLLSKDLPAYRERPLTGNWSILENLQHLVFAEQAHFRRYLAEPPPWSRFALSDAGPTASKGTAILAANTAEVFAEWEAVHEATKTLAGTNDARLLNRMDRHIKHLRAHARVIERLLRTQAKPKR